jgi:phosphoribosylglycinamide formyltransferase-1
MSRLDLGVLVSGNGTNLQAILDACGSGQLAADVKLVISNQPDAFALERARRAGVPARCISHREFASRAAFDTALADALERAGAGWVVLAGFMRVLTPAFLDRFPGRIVNIHPALLPAFPGTHAQRQALEYGAKASGCTVHFVDAGTDSGPVIAQVAVQVHDDDTEATLSERILVEEHRLLVSALQAIAEDRVHVRKGEGGRDRVVVRPA